MKAITSRLFFFFVCSVLLLQGCTYHGKIHRGIYHHDDYEEKIDARVMVVSDRFFQNTLSVDGETNKYTFRLSDGLPIAVADALATLFTEVDVNEYRYRKNYDYIVEIDYQARLQMKLGKFVNPRVLFSWYDVNPVLLSQMQLTVRNPKTGYAVARYDYGNEKYIATAKNDFLLATTSFLQLITLGILTPVNMQTFGSKLRRQIEKDITTGLSKQIMPDMADDRLNFTKAHTTEQTDTRIDGKFIPFMQATVFITTDRSLGSGFLIDPRGYIITNAHVVEDNRDVGVVLYDERQIMDKTNPIALPNPNTMRNKVRFAKVLKVNRARDIALIKIEGENFPWLELDTNRNHYTTGKTVVALGAPRSIEWSVSQGIISATRSTNGSDTIQTDTAINGGNSGGPLIDLTTGKVLGINSWSRKPEQNLEDMRHGTEALHFAISAFEIKRTLGVTQPVKPDDFPYPAD